MIAVGLLSTQPDVGAFSAGFSAVVFAAIAVVVAFVGINFIRKMFSI